MRNLRNLFIGASVFLSTLLVIYLLFLMPALYLVPWDTTALEFRPEVGTWQRTLNDFFEAGVGINILWMFAASFAAIPVIRTLQKNWDAGLRVMVANLIFFFGGWSIMIGAYALIYWIFPNPQPVTTVAEAAATRGYGNAILPMILYISFYALWTRELVQLRKRPALRKQKAKNSDLSEAHHRLEDHANSNHTGDFHQDTVAIEARLTSQ